MSQRLSAVRRLLRKYMPELIYGANDGLVTTFAIVSGVVGANLASKVVLILGFASLLADGFSMGASDFLSERSKLDDQGRRRPTGHAARHGLATFIAFVIAGAAPLIAYLLPIEATWQFAMAATLTLVVLFAVGSARSAVSELRWFRSGIEMLVVGAVAAGVAYGIGALVSLLTGQMPAA